QTSTAAMAAAADTAKPRPKTSPKSIKFLFGGLAGYVCAHVCSGALCCMDQRRGYTNVFNALVRITREEGVSTLWRGCVPTMARAVVVNAAQLASYSQSKQALLDSGYFRDDILCHFCASMISGLVTTAASMPVDIVKTRIQNMRMIDGKPEYKNGLDVLVTVIRKEGFFSLWKGFTPYYARLGPHTVLTFIFLEQMNKFYKIYFLDS
uniref:Mitochondrial 2-oxoglutarate/malate carrier protein-like n=1 Tax=Sinocyclocheilus grahami TaxID=75366 RepID=A0A672KF90_SINGR